MAGVFFFFLDEPNRKKIHDLDLDQNLNSLLPAPSAPLRSSSSPTPSRPRQTPSSSRTRA